MNDKQRPSLLWLWIVLGIGAVGAAVVGLVVDVAGMFLLRSSPNTTKTQAANLPPIKFQYDVELLNEYIEKVVSADAQLTGKQVEVVLRSPALERDSKGNY